MGPLLTAHSSIWTQIVGGCYKGQIYGMETAYSSSYSPTFMFGARSTGVDMEDIWDRVHALNESMQK